ncbi:hypothetical protein RB195_020949 [Necator americanus]
MINAKSLTIVPSDSFHGKEGKVESSDFIKKPIDVDYEDETAVSTIQPRTNFRVDFTKVNGSEIVASRRTIFEVIPVDYLCDFCIAVIEKLKYRQQVEKDFEQNMLDECWKYNQTSLDDGNVCELINKVTLKRLQDDDVTKICVDEKMCPDKEKELKKQEENEKKEREEASKRKKEEEERKKNEEVENIKTEAARLEYQKRREQEEKKLAEQRRITQTHGETGDLEYVIDEVGKAEDDKNDYLEYSSEKLDTEGGQIRNETQVDGLSATENGTGLEKSEKPPVSKKPESATITTTRTTVSVPLKNDAVKIAPGRISGEANVSPRGRFFIDRTVELKLNVEDLRR